MQRKAIPMAAADTPIAPDVPSLWINRNTVTTKTFNGTPNNVIITDRWESGRYLLRSVPMDGKYIPAHISKMKKPAMTPARLVFAEMEKVAPANARAAVANMTVVECSVGTDHCVSCPKSVDPSRQHDIRQLNTWP